MELSADHIRSLQRYDLRILKSLEHLMERYAIVPAEEIAADTRLSLQEVTYRVRSLIDIGMVKYQAIPYPGYALLFNGYDSLALHTLSKKNTVRSLGCRIGEGKESIVYEAMGLGTLVLKFHRIGQRSFHTVRKNRDIIPDIGHCPWIFASAFSAQHEYTALAALHQRIPVPVPIALNRNCVAMTEIPGTTLNRCTVSDPERIWTLILSYVRIAYQNGFIHGDLSEYNIMYSGTQPVIIDWPQWVDPSHKNALEIVSHDINTISTHFIRKYALDISFPEALETVTV